MKIGSNIKAVCFDMDDTILRTNVEYKRMADLIFDETVKVGVPESAINRNDGSKMNLDSGLKYLVEHGREDLIPVITKNVEKGIHDIEMENVEKARPFAKTKDLLMKIHSDGFKTGILTRGCREYAEAACRICGIFDYLDAFVARDDYALQDAKPSPKAMFHIADELGVDPSEILFIGDQRADYQCAQGAGSEFIAVTTGPYTEEDWHGLGVNTVYKSVNELFEDLE